MKRMYSLRKPFLLSLLIAIVLVTTLFVYEQKPKRRSTDPESVEINSKRKIVLQALHDKNDKYVNFENNDVIITLSYEEAVSVLNNKNIKDNNNLNGSFNKNLFTLLTSGKYTVYDKKASQEVSYVIVESYVNTCKPLCGGSGERFISPASNTIFYIHDTSID